MIKMIAGVYGLHVDGIVKAMSKDSGPFEASKEQEARLVQMGLAVYVDDAPIGFDEQPNEPKPDLPDLPADVAPIPEYSISNTAQELREIGKLCGLTFKVGMTKAEMVAALDAHIEAHTVDGYDADTEDSSDDDEPAPTFDPAEAVQ